MKNMNYWFYLETYTYLSSDEYNVLLYNTLSGKSFRIEAGHVLGKLLKEYEGGDRKCLELTDDDLVADGVMSYIFSIRNLFMGDLIEKRTDVPPFIFPFKLDFKLDSAKRLRFDYSKDKRQLTYLKEVSFFPFLFDRVGDLSVDPYFYSLSGIFNETEFADNLHFIEEFIKVNPLFLNLPDNVLDYPALMEGLGNMLNPQVTTTINLHYSDRYSNDILLKAQNAGYKLNLYVDDAFPSSLSMLDIWIQQIKYCSLDCVIKFLIPSEESLVLAESRMENEAVENYQIVPYYNGDNIEFFKQFIYLDEEDILSARLDKQAIFRNQVLNSYDFGKINIFSDGDIYANLNFEKLGNVGVDSIADIICEELTSGKSWLRVRSEKPCCDCLYQWLCPSPSNYELAIGKTDLCNKS